MDPHHLYQAASNPNLRSASKAAANNNTSGKGKGFLSRIYKLRSKNPLSSSAVAISPPTPANPFKMVHEPDTTPLYHPSRPNMPRTPSEYKKALQEMWEPRALAHQTFQPRRPSTAPGEGPAFRNQNLPEHRRPPPPPPPPPKDGLLPPRSFPLRAPLNTNIQPPLPRPPRTAGARLETIPGSPLSSETIRSLSEPTNWRVFPMTPRTPRTVDSKQTQRTMRGRASRPPRPLSERALIPMERLRLDEDGTHAPRSSLSRTGPLTSSPVRTTFAGEAEAARPALLPRTQTQPRERRNSPLNPLSHSTPKVLSSTRSTYISIDDVVAPRRQAGPETPEPPSVRRPRPSHQPLSFDSMRVYDGVDSSSIDDEERTPTAFDSLRILPAQRVEGDLTAVPTSPQQAKCLLCPEPCPPSQGLCIACTEHYRPQDSDFEDSESDYESIVVETPTLPPRRTKPKPLSIQAAPQHSSTSTAPPVPVTPTRVPSFSRPITPTRSPQRVDFNTPPYSPPTPDTPRGWARVSTPTNPPAADSTNDRSLSSSPGTPHVAQQLKVMSSPTPHKVSLGSPVVVKRSSALYHLERSMQLNNWAPLAQGASPKTGYDVVRVTSGAARRVVLRDSNDVNADTMKMLVDHEVAEEARRHDGGGGGYGDFFSYYAEKEEREDKEAEEETEIYDRIQSIYDAYGGDEKEEDETEEANMF